MTAKKKSPKKIAEFSYETKALTFTIANEDGVHAHSRNGEKFCGKLANCPLCKTGSEFERRMGEIGACAAENPHRWFLNIEQIMLLLDRLNEGNPNYTPYWAKADVKP